MPTALRGDCDECSTKSGGVEDNRPRSKNQNCAVSTTRARQGRDSEHRLPGRELRPSAQGAFCPGGGFVLVAGGARVGDLVFVRHGRGNEAESVSVNERAGHAFGFDPRHMAGHALVSGAARFVMGVLFEGGRMRTVGGRRTMTIEADFSRRLSQLSIVLCAMGVVTGGTGNSVPIHDALHKIVALHAVLVRGAVREIVERGLTKGTVFKLPEVLQL